MFVGRGDFEEHEWEEIRKQEKANFKEQTRIYMDYLKQEFREWNENYKWEYKLSKKMKKEMYEKGMK